MVAAAACRGAPRGRARLPQTAYALLRAAAPCRAPTAPGKPSTGAWQAVNSNGRTNPTSSALIAAARLCAGALSLRAQSPGGTSRLLLPPSFLPARRAPTRAARWVFRSVDPTRRKQRAACSALRGQSNVRLPPDTAFLTHAPSAAGVCAGVCCVVCFAVYSPRWPRLRWGVHVTATFINTLYNGTRLARAHRVGSSACFVARSGA